MSLVAPPDPHHLSRINALLEVALALEPQEREAWLQGLASTEQTFVPLVRAMLSRAAVSTDDFMRRPLKVNLDQADDLNTADDRAGDTVGPYRLLSELGAGGMGTVWLAERCDGALQRQVALKLPHAGWARGLAQRMARERDFLAALEHPRIARLYDAGVTPEGRPWMAMERVTGVPIDTYCREHQLDVTQRLLLFLQVADAVAHAHAHLIVHRDLKPSNILVTAEGEVRLLDFGVAKLIDTDTAAAPSLTQLMGRAVTPDYASPEQVAGKPVTVATDVYSLGVVLYELLTGQRPYRLARQSTAALEEAILAIDVPPASHRARDRRLARALRGDLDTVLAKALCKEADKRYPSVGSMAADIQRHLSGEEVLAQPRSTRYRLSKFVGRYRLEVAGGAAIAIAIVTGAGVSLWQAREARLQAAAAQREAQRAQAVQDVLLGIFKTNTVQQADPIRARQTTARELLDIGAKQAATRLEGVPEAQDIVLNMLADMYYQMELPEEAARIRQQLVAALTKGYGPDDPRVADALLQYANDVDMTDQPARALEALLQARAVLDRARDFSSPTRGHTWLASARIEQYLSVQNMRRDAEAALAHFRAHPARWSDDFKSLQAVARSQFLAGNLAEASSRHREAIALAEKNQNGPSAWSITPLVQLAEAQIAALEFDAAEQNLRSALSLSRKLVGENVGSTLQTQVKLGSFLYTSGYREEGAALVRDAQQRLSDGNTKVTPEALGAVQRARGIVMQFDGRSAQAEPFLAAEVADLRRQLPGSLPLANALLLQAAPLVTLGRYEAAELALDEAWHLWQLSSGEKAAPATTNRHRLAQARLRLARGDAVAAEALLHAMLPPRDADKLALRADDAQAKVLLAQARLLQKQPEDAQRLAREALDMLRASPLRARFAWLEAEALQRIGQALQHSGQPALAKAELERALAHRQASEVPASPVLADVQIALADCLVDLGERKPAMALWGQARAVHAANTELGDHFRQPLARLAQRLSGTNVPR